MNIVSKALDEVKYSIPNSVLIETFKDDRNYWRRSGVSIDELILNKIVRPRVMVDVNLIGGPSVNISLEGLRPEMVDNYTMVYTVPKNRTQNRSITSILSVSYMPVGIAGSFGMNSSGYSGINPMSMNTMTTTAQRIGDAVSSAPPVSNAQAELIGENTVMLRDQFRMTANYSLLCTLEFDTKFNGLNVRAAREFAKITVLAVKAYIYNTMMVRIDEAFLQGGQELGVFKSIVEGYADSEEMYQTRLTEVMQAALFMTDTKAHTRFMRIQVNPGI